MERASKLGHMKLIDDERGIRLLDQFEQAGSASHAPIGSGTGRIDLHAPSSIRFVITVDGGEAIVPNELRRDKCLAFIKFCAVLIRRADIAQLRQNPVVDPRDLARLFADNVWYQAAALPLAGIHMPDQTVKDTIREAVDAVLEYTRLDEVLDYLVFSPLGC
jgi:hypothetical protein